MNTALKRVFQVYVLAFCFFFASRPLTDGDFWFHLKTGEFVFQNHSVPRTELYSFTNYGSPWIAHGWLSGLSFFGVYETLGFNALIFIFASLTVLAFWIVSRQARTNFIVSGLVTLLGVWAVLPNLGVRPRVFTLLFSAIYLFVLKRYLQRQLQVGIWWLVPLMALWVNLHGGYLIGLALIAWAVIAVVIDGWTEKSSLNVWPLCRTLLLVLLASMIAVLLNPYGIRMYTFPLAVLRSPVFQDYVIDWLSPNFHQSEMFPFTLLILLTTAAMTLSPKRVPISQLLLFLATLYASLKAQRNILVFALVAVPLLAEYGQSWLDGSFITGLRSSSITAPATRRQTALAPVLLLPLILFFLKLQSAVYGPLKQSVAQVPIKAVDYMRQHGITGNTFTDPNMWGGYLIWALPSNPVFIDGRDVYPQRFVGEYVEITNGVRDWKGPFRTYGVRNIIVPISSYLANELEQSSEWRKVYGDDYALVYVRNDSSAR